jgi:hypothetical protein
LDLPPAGAVARAGSQGLFASWTPAMSAGESVDFIFPFSCFRLLLCAVIDSAPERISRALFTCLLFTARFATFDRPFGALGFFFRRHSSAFGFFCHVVPFFRMSCLQWFLWSRLRDYI